MIDIIEFLGTFGILSVMVLCYILAKLSEKFGAVVKMPPIYRYYYLALLLLSIGYITQLLMLGDASQDVAVWGYSPWLILLLHHFSLAIGVTICLLITWRYWNWLLTEDEA